MDMNGTFEIRVFGFIYDNELLESPKKSNLLDNVLNPIYEKILLSDEIFQDDVLELDLEAELLASTFDRNRSSYSRDNTYFSSQSSACGSGKFLNIKVIRVGSDNFVDLFLQKILQN